MSDETTIEPALSAAEWARVDALDTRQRMQTVSDMFRTFAFGADIPRAIAVLNEALPDSDPRKITRERLEMLRGAWRSAYYLPETFIDALASYLPPEN